MIFSYLSTVILFNTHSFFNAWDLHFHVERILELESSFSHGNIFPMFSLNGDHGVANLILYPSINLLPIIFGHLFIKSNIVLIYLFIDLNIFMSLLCTYYGSLYLTRNKLSSFILSVIYSISFPFLSESFYNVDLGALTAMAFLPLALFGFIKIFILRYNKKNYLEFIIGTTLIIYSHVLTTLILCMFMGIYILLNLKQIHKCQCVKILKSIIIIMLLTSIIYLPAIMLTLNQNGQIASPGTRILYGQTFISILKSSINGYTTAYINIFAIIGTILPLLFYKKLNYEEKQLYWISIIFLFICSNLFPWDIINNIKIFKPFRIIQFTWRFYIIPELLLDYLFSICIVKFLSNKATNLITIASILFIFITSFYGQHWYIQNVPNISSYNYNNSKIILPMSHKRINLRALKVNMLKSPARPKYKVSNNNNLKELALAPISNVTEPDYYPLSSTIQFNNINNNMGLINNRYQIHIKHYSYNKFTFNNKHRINKLTLPIVNYNKEHIKTYLDNKPINNNKDKHQMITIHNVNTGNHILKIKYIPNKLLIESCLILLILGIISILSKCI